MSAFGGKADIAPTSHSASIRMACHAYADALISDSRDGSAVMTPALNTVILKSEIYNFHWLDLMRQVGFIVTVYDEEALKLTTTNPCSPLPRRLRKLEKS
jgi:hypothetical protein